MQVQQVPLCNIGYALSRQMIWAFVSTGGLGDSQVVSEAMQVVQQWQAKRAAVSPVDTEKCRCCS